MQFRSESMDWQQRLKSLVVDDSKRGKILFKLLRETTEFRTAVFDDNDDAVRAALLDMIEPPAVAEQPSKRPRTVGKVIELFVQSAAESYTKWERKYKLALPKVGEDTEEKHRLFLEVKSDPLCNFLGGFLLWVRECYIDMKNILLAAKPGQRFTILGTSGIGKSLFTVFWMCYLATLQKKVVWKQAVQSLFLLDFSGEPSAEAYDSMNHPDIQEVLDDVNAWLVIDGRQAGNLVCKCRIVHSCSMRPENYKEYAKNHQVELQYFPVWEEEEVCQFLDEFEQYRVDYQGMNVPVREVALGYFEKIGGVARYVLCGNNAKRRLEYVESAVGNLSGDTCLEYCAGKFEQGEKSDALVHIKCRQSKDEKYSRYFYDIAPSDVRRQFLKRFEQVSKVNVVQFLKSYANSTDAGNNYGFVFEFVAHDLFKRGGQFRMKKVTRGGDPEEVAPLKVPMPLNVAFFKSLKEFSRFEAGTYYRPQAGNFKSIDAILHPDYLLQYFSYSRGIHGYMVNGLEEVGDALGLSKFKVCSCVPIDKYDETGFQPWLTTKKLHYKDAALPQIIKDSEQYVIAVDYNILSS